MDKLYSSFEAAEFESENWLIFESKNEFDLFVSSNTELLEARWLFGQRLDAAFSRGGKYHGYCQLCKCFTLFSYQTVNGLPDLRESFSCESCNLNARLRVVLGLLKRWLPASKNPSVYITEQTTDAYRWLHSNYANVYGSEYFDRATAQRLKDYLTVLVGKEERLNFQDITDLKLDSSSKDVVISCDVLEHVPDYRKALRQFARVLKPDGLLILTVPFMDSIETTIIRARIDTNGEIEHLMEPEYHGDPLSEQGILAYYNFAWDLLETVRESGFREAYWARPWNPSSAMFNELWCLVARR